MRRVQCTQCLTKSSLKILECYVYDHYKVFSEKDKNFEKMLLILLCEGDGESHKLWYGLREFLTPG